MIPSDVKALGEELRKAGIRFVVVGGKSLERKWFVGTMDIDVAVTLKDYQLALKRLRDHPRFRYIEDEETIAGSQFRHGTEWIDVEFINPKLFSGNRPPDDFIDYVRRHRSHADDGIVFADPEVVWYMRLAAPYWEAYVSKIARDVRAGVPPETLNRVLDMGRHFGNFETMSARVEQVRRMLGLLRTSSPSQDRPPRSTPAKPRGDPAGIRVRARRRGRSRRR